ncbi:hypothetical protein CLV78_102661 [Aliiruegeria haliotis]|uniref:Uncharacterized protein n=1 Tax=Aliiruegeria haliotis TaxID=1280846 RepID=A0A2T0RWD0_9RHOB|nr:hypothetical protein [Aliiruegeria haliotis]PRY25481.1 hypothetical protein CLV78_102661 [Aliiruegeria haliotis]
MKKNYLALFAAMGFAIAAGTASADTVTVMCESGTAGTNNAITFNEEDGAMLKEELGAGFEDTVCEVGKQLNWPDYETPTQVKVTMSNGNEYDIMAQQVK